jgi:LGFP repeat/Calcineurin-like phosphoesterase
MFEEIEAKRNELRQQGIDVGAPQGDAREAGFGGAVRDFAVGSIYWHPNTGAHFLTGAIRSTYLALHGPGLDPECFLRPLGFPTTDNVKDARRKIEFADFELGSIYSVGGRFGFAIHQGLAAGLPKLAMPTFVGPTGFKIKLPPVTGVLLSPNENLAATISTIQALWAKRIGLQRVDKPTEIVNLAVHVTVEAAGLASSKPRLEQHAALPAGASLKERKLYNFILRNPRGEVLKIAPHAFYCRSNWDAFGVIHVTDTHLAARLDHIQRQLAEKGAREGIANFINFNDSFRHLVRYANKLHRKGQLDLILLTGDVVDYQYETSDERADLGGGGNFAVLERLVLGQEPSPTGVPAEELCVPISATLGNHDYRENQVGGAARAGKRLGAHANGWARSFTDRKTRRLFSAVLRT